MDADPPNRAVHALEKHGHPVVTLTLRDKLDLGGEFFRWEVATAIAGAILGIDAFDQPNVQESKDNTKKVLATFKSRGKLPPAETTPAAKSKAGIASLLKRAKRGAYFATMAYTARTPQSEAAIAAIRTAIRDKTKIATTSGYGPRFLHSTGQLHKGGPKTGLFLQIVQDDVKDAPIAGQPFDHLKAGVVSGSNIFQSRVPQAHDEIKVLHARACLDRPEARLPGATLTSSSPPSFLHLCRRLFLRLSRPSPAAWPPHPLLLSRLLPSSP